MFFNPVSSISNNLRGTGERGERGGDSQAVLILRCLPAVAEVVGVGRGGAVWFGEVIAGVTVVVPAETTSLA